MVMDCLNDHSSIFAIINKLLHRSSASPLPSYDSAALLAQEFTEFFDNKIVKINHQLDCMIPVETNQTMIKETCDSHLSSFTPFTESEIIKLIRGYPIKSCPLDPLLAVVFKDIHTFMIPLLTTIVNASFASATVPASMKEAMINPILKKPHLDKVILNNYHPVSNLTFISKLIEMVVVKQLIDHLEVNLLSDKFQSAYRQCHSTETALTPVLNGILLALDRREAVFLILSDLSAVTSRT